MSYQDSQSMISISNPENCPSQPYILREDEKIPLFLIKLWNIVEDPGYYDVIRWDESGYSFHIMDPYSFCRNVLPQFFKHNNLNSLIRQLNMYGFRKMTPIERTSLAHAESDQDHLEFSHPYFVREHPELLVNIKRKVPNNRQAGNAVNAKYDRKAATPTVNVPAKDLNSVLEELRQMRERQKNMEQRISEVVKENEMVWLEMGHLRSAHMKQQQIVNKLVQFLVSLVQPSKQQRLGKRHLLAIDEFQTKRSHDAEYGSSSGNSATRLFDNLAMGSDSKNLCDNYQLNANEVLDTLINEMSSDGVINLPSILIPRSSFASGNSGPIIAEVTDELDQLNATTATGKTDSSSLHQGPKFSQPRVNRRKTSAYEGVQNVSNVVGLQQQHVRSSDAARQQLIKKQIRPLPFKPQQASTRSQPLVQSAADRQPYANRRNDIVTNITNVPRNAQRNNSNVSNMLRYDENETQQLSNTITSQGIHPPPHFGQQHQISTSSTVQHSSSLNLQMIQRGADKPIPELSYDPEDVMIQNLPAPTQQQQIDLSAEPLRHRSYSLSSYAVRSPIVESPSSQNDLYTSNVGRTVRSPVVNANLNSTCAVIDTVEPQISGLLPDGSQRTAGASGDPRITFNDSPSDFGEYLNSMNHSIDECRNNIANHWELNHLMEEIDPNEWPDLLLDDESVRLAEYDNNTAPPPYNNTPNQQIQSASVENIQLMNTDN